MALSARELFLIVRAQNQASGVLRGVSADMAALGKKEVLSARRAQLGLQRQKLLNTQQRITNQIAKETTGSSAINRQMRQAALDKQRATLGRSINSGMAQRQSLQRKLYDADTRDLQLQDRKRKILRALGDTGKQMRELRTARIVDPESRDVERQISKVKRASTDLGKQLSIVNRQIKSNFSGIRGLNGAYGQINNTMRGHIQSLRDTSLAQEKLNAQTAESSLKTAEMRRNLQANVQSLIQNNQKFKQLDQAEKAFKMDRIAQATHLVGSMGRQLQLVGFGGAAALGFAANAAANLSTQVTLATTQYKNNVGQIKTASDTNFGAIIKDMQQFPASADDMAKSLYDIFSTLNVNGRQGRDILVQVNKAAVAGQLSVQDATQGVLSVLSNFKEISQDSEGTAGALNRMFAAVRFGRVTMQQFATSLQTTAPAANQTGQTFDNLAGSVAFLSRSLGINKASVGYARLLQQLTSTKMVEGLKKHGISVRDAAGHYKQLDVIMGEINQEFPKLAKGQESAQNFFKAISGTSGTIQGARAFTSIIKNISGYRDILHKTTGDNNEFQKSFDALNQTAGVQFGKALNVLKSLWLELGHAAIPVIAKLLSPIGELAQKLSSMDQATKDNIGRIVAIGLAITAVTGVVLSLVSAIGGALLIFQGLGVVMTGGIVLGFIALGAAILLVIKHWDTLGPRIQSALPALQNAVQSAVGGIQNILEKTAGLIASFIGVVDALIRGDWGDLWNSAGEAVGNFSDLVTIALRGVGQIAQNFFNMAVSSTQGYIAATALATVGIVKLIGFLRELAVAYELVAARTAIADAAATGGLGASVGAGIGKYMSSLKGLSAVYKESRASGMGFGRSLASLTPLLFGASAGTVALVAGLVAVGIGIAVLIDKYDKTTYHVDGFTAAQQASIAAAQGLTTNLNAEADAVNNLGSAFDTLQGAQLDKKQAQLDAKQAVLSYRQARTAARADGKISQQERLTLEGLRLNITRTQRASVKAQQDYLKAHGDFRDLARKANQQLSGTDYQASQQQLRTLKAQRDAAAKQLPGLTAKAETGGIQDMLNLVAQQGKIAALNQQIQNVGNTAAATRQKVITAVNKYIQTAVPNVSKEQLQYLSQVSEKVGHILTGKQMRILLKTQGAKEAVAQIKELEQRGKELGRRKTVMHVTTQVDTKGMSAANVARQQFQAHHAMGAGPAAQITANPQPAIAAAKKAGDAVDKVGRKVVHPKINAQFKPDVGAIQAEGVSAGAAAKGGVLLGASGLGDQLGAQMSADVLAAIAAAKKAAQATSPSKKTKKEIGIPLAQGIIAGFSEEMKRHWKHTAESVQRLIIKGLDFSGQSAKEKAKTISDAFKQAMDTAIQTLTDKWNEIHDLNKQNFGELFQGEAIQTKLDWGAKLSIADLQKDLSTQLGAFRKFNASLNALRRRGAPQSLIDQLRQLGPSAQGEIDALTGATKKELRKYENTWKQSQKNINKATKQQFKQQIKEWKSQGKAIAAGILMGLRSGQPALEKYFRRIWLNMIAATKKHNKSHSPSKLYAEEGMNIMEGLRLGLERGARGLAVPGPGVGPAWGGGRGREGRGGGTVIYQTINAHHSESLSTTLRKANFRLKHRNT